MALRDEFTVFLEGRTDEWMVKRIFSAAGFYESRKINFIAIASKKAMAKALAPIQQHEARSYVALIDADVASVADSRELARQQLGHPHVEVFCAVPTIEAWMFADPEMPYSLARSAAAKDTISRLPLPEEIPHPKQLAVYLFGNAFSSKIKYDIPFNLSLAMARSPSLRIFTEGIGNILGIRVDHDFPTQRMSDTRNVVATLLRELPSEQVAWVTMSGEPINAGTLASAISDGLPIGNQYATELLRVARDLISRQAKPKK